jgi:cytochrome P450
MDGAGQLTHFDRSAAEIQRFIREQLAALNGTGLLTALREEQSGERLTDDEVVATAALLLVAGFETSANFFGNLLLGLLWHPDRYRELVARPDLVNCAIEELLRLYGPAHIVFRRARRELEVGGQMIDSGARIAVLLRASNLDERVFEDPHSYRPRRDPNPHLAFSHGIHYCLGAGLARVEATAMLRTLVEVAPELALSDTVPPEWEPRLLGRGLARLEVIGR